MKYIRTPIGIYDLENSVFYDFDGLCKYHISHCEYYENNPEDCKTSDTIEELCDEFVGVDNTCENGHQLLRAIPYKCANFWNGGVYGAIWTSKGLIYIAKMNDKGELELI